MVYVYYTDGACSGNPGPGGWGWVKVEEKSFPKYHENGYELSTTNNRMELMAVVSAITHCISNYPLIPGDTIRIYSDSAYVVNAFTLGWLDKWRWGGWKNKEGKTIANKELWQTLDKVMESLEELDIAVLYLKVKGHSGDFYNDLADREAVMARDEAIWKAAEND